MQGNAISGATSRFDTVTVSGYYSCNVTIGNCVYTSNDTFLINGIKDIKDIQNVIVSPNPSTGSFTISFKTNDNKEIQIGIYDLIGQLVQAEAPVKVSGAYNKQIDLSNVIKGIYVLQIKTEDVILNRKIEIN